MFFVPMQYLLPQHALSRVVLRATRVRLPVFKNALIGAFLRGFKPDMSDAVVTDAHAYASFNDFFTRALRSDARPVAREADAIASPVDGTVSEAGVIDEGQLLQAKGHNYGLDALLAGAATPWSSHFAHGNFATIYLAPYNYHRIHMPCDGTLREAWYVPGKLFSVNTATAAAVPGLFARNERVVLLFDGTCGPFAVILVGALFVGSMTTVWHGDVTPRSPRTVAQLPMTDLQAPRALRKGAELGRFNMGSTVILLFGRGCVDFDAHVVAGQRVKMGEHFGKVSPVGG